MSLALPHHYYDIKITQYDDMVNITIENFMGILNLISIYYIMNLK